MAAQNKKVHIFEADGEYRVHPPLLDLDGGQADTITMKNNTGEDLVVYFPAKACVATVANDPVAVPLDKNKKITVTAASQGVAGTSNLYAYQVIAPKSGKKAKGNSDPVLVIEN